MNEKERIRIKMPYRSKIISIFILIIFGSGFLVGGSLIYIVTSTESYELQDQIQSIYHEKTNLELQNDNYYSNGSLLSNLYRNVKDSIVVISGTVTYQSFFGLGHTEVQGSGFTYKFNEEFIVITNNHVVSDASDLVVTFANGNGYPAEIIGSDSYSDLAVLSVDAPIEEFYPLEIVSSSNLEVGDPVVAIGNPMGLDGTMTIGIVSQIGRTIRESLAGSFPIANIIQTSVAINPGNSGGPLFNYQGEVVGVTTAIIENSESLGFAIPSNTILKEIESLIETGSFSNHSWLGISGVDVTYSIAQAIGSNVTYGWLISQVTQDSAADDADLKGGSQQIQIIDERIIIGGDIIIAIDGNRVTNGDYLMSYLEEYTSPNQIVTLSILRGNQLLDVPVTLGARPMIN